jgi:hypothetical protein
MVPSTSQEAPFELSQETRDGIPLRFKGLVIYRVARPERTARLFDFTGDEGHQQICSQIRHICLGELRAVVAGMTMDECIEQRKTVLSQLLARSLAKIVHAEDESRVESDDWGIELDLVQVAQVFIIDAELRQQLEAEVRDKIRTDSEASRIRSDEALAQVRMASERALEEEHLKTERQRTAASREKIDLRQRLARHEIESEAPVQILRMEVEQRALELERVVRAAENEVIALRVEGNNFGKRAEQNLRKEMLPIEQTPEIVRAAASMLNGAHVYLTGEQSNVVSALGPVIDLIGEQVRKSTAD